ncbi:hypothetical protein [Algoriphagus sp.]|uniref:hypothetical protein n=1 Tax=Algoriphagus sp. TaxID=1872435 RepID=UPI003F70D895
MEVHTSGKSSNRTGRDLGIPGDMIRQWSREFILTGQAGFSGSGKTILSSVQRELVEPKKTMKENESYFKKDRKHLHQVRQQIFRFMKDHKGNLQWRKCAGFSILP